MGHLADLLTRLAEDRVRRGRQFERVCKWFLENDPLYTHQVRRVWLWDEWPGRWAADAGIDLVVEDRERGLWAVQAKAYDPAYSVTKSDVDTFLSESSRPEFSYRLLIATTNRVGITARRTLAAMLRQRGPDGLGPALRAWSRRLRWRAVRASCDPRTLGATTCP